MILKSNDELCTIDVGVIFKIRSRVNSKSSIGSGTGSIKNIESKSNFSTANEDTKSKLLDIDEKSTENHDNLSVASEREESVASQPVRDNSVENEDLTPSEGDVTDLVSGVSDANSATLPVSLSLQEENKIDESHVLNDQSESEVLTTTNEINIEKNMNLNTVNSNRISPGKSDTCINTTTTKTEEKPRSAKECPEPHEFKTDGKHQKNEDGFKPVQTDNKDLSPGNDGDDKLDACDSQDDNEFTSDIDAWGGVFSELDAWNDVFADEELATPKDRQDTKTLDLPDTASKNSSSYTNHHVLLSQEDIMSNKVTNEELLQVIESVNYPTEDPKIGTVFPGDPAELEDYDSKELLGQEEKAAKSLRSLAILSKNPECHPVILSLLFAPNVALQKDKSRTSPRTLSVQLTALAHTECAVKSLHRYLASLIFMLCQVSETNICDSSN